MRNQIAIDSVAKSAEPAPLAIDDVVAAAWQRTFGVPACRGEGLLDVMAHADGVMRSRQLGRLLSEIGVATGVQLPLTVAFSSPTAAQLGEMIRSRESPPFERPVRIQHGAGQSLFVFPGLGAMGLDTLALVRRLTVPGSVYLNPPQGLDGTEPHGTLEAVIADHISGIRKVQPNGPYWLLGYSWGGVVAIEIARCLQDSGEAIAFLGVIDPVLNMTDWTYSAWFDYFSDRIRHQLELLSRMRSPGAAIRFCSKGLVSTTDKILRLFGVYRFWPLAAPGAALPDPLGAVWKAESEIIKAYRLQYYAGNVTFFASRSGHAKSCPPEKIWPSKVGRLDLRWAASDHKLTEPTVKDLADNISAAIADHIGQL